MGKFGDFLRSGVGSGLIGMGIGAVGSALGGIGSKRRSRRQLNQQMKLNEQAAALNYEYGEKSAENAYARQMQLYERTYQDESPENRVQQLNDAGLSVGLMYGNGAGAGGAGQATTAPQGSGASGQQAGQASNETERQMAAQNAIAMGLQMAKMKSEVDVNESIAEKNKADAGLASEKTTTETSQRDTFIEKLRQEGIAQWLENNITKVRMDDRTNEKNIENIEETNYKLDERVNISMKSRILQKDAIEITKAYAETLESQSKVKANEAIALLDTERKKGYWTELLNATARADAETVKAEAIKLAAEHSTGEFTNWRTWADVGTNIMTLIAKIFK